MTTGEVLPPEAEATPAAPLPQAARRGIPTAAATPGVAASLVLHAVLVAALLIFLPATTRSKPAEEDSVDVQFLTPDELTAMVDPAEIAPPAPASAVVNPSSGGSEAAPHAAPPPAPSAPPMIRATRMLSGGALADPRSRQARDALPHLAADERMVQLCDLEAMEQVHQWQPDSRPDRVVAYAMSEVAIAKDTIVANGAAIRGNGGWRTLRFTCGLLPDHAEVVSFAFQVGDPVPKEEWEAHHLAATE